MQNQGSSFATRQRVDVASNEAEIGSTDSDEIDMTAWEAALATYERTETPTPALPPEFPASADVTQDFLIADVVAAGVTADRLTAPDISEFELDLYEGTGVEVLPDPTEAEAAPLPRELPSTRGPRHRMPAPPQAAKGRIALLALATGAIAVAGGMAVSKPKLDSDKPTVKPVDASVVAAADGSNQERSNAGDSLPANPGQDPPFTSGLDAGSFFHDANLAAAAAASRPMFACPTVGAFTSSFAPRWGTIHGGVDIANTIGTPIYAAHDGVVKEAGPASGFGQWVVLVADDGTETVYGHVSAYLVSSGQRVTAGDTIALMGNLGFSTGSHLHFEVHQNGVKIDPLPWLNDRGCSLGNLTE